MYIYYLCLKYLLFLICACIILLACDLPRLTPVREHHRSIAKTGEVREEYLQELRMVSTNHVKVCTTNSITLLSHYLLFVLCGDGVCIYIVLLGGGGEESRGGIRKS